MVNAKLQTKECRVLCWSILNGIRVSLLLFLFSQPSLAQTITFGSPTDTTVIDDPISMVADDFDNNGTKDLAVSGTSAFNDLTILLNDGSGNFTSVLNSNSFASSPPSTVQSADLDRDGNADLVIVQIDTFQMDVLLGNGDGTFSAAAESPRLVPNSTSSPTLKGMDIFVLEDFDKDGILDVATRGGGMMFGDGDGTFTNGTPFATSPPNSLSQPGSGEDFNRDGNNDLFLALFSAVSGTQRNIIFGDGAGGFSGGSSVFGTNMGGNGGSTLAVGDLNRDGILDVVEASRDTTNVNVYLGNGSGGFALASGSPHFIGSPLSSVAIEDLNGDGNPDVVVGHADFNANGTFPSALVTVYTGDGLGGLSRTDLTLDNGTKRVVIEDFNRDGRPDLAVSNGLFDKVSLLLNQTTFNESGFFVQPPSSPIGMADASVGILSGDYNRDGHPDLANFNGNGFGVGREPDFLFGNGDGTFTIATNTIVTAGGDPVQGDLDRDGDLDFFLTDFGSSQNVLLNNGNGTFVNNNLAINFHHGGVPPADVNQDGILDLVGTVEGVDLTTLLGVGDGTFTVVSPAFTGLQDGEPFALGDFNQDGQIDVFGSQLGGSPFNRLIFFGNGDGTFTYSGVVNPVTQSQITHAITGDFDRDGLLDIVELDGLNSRVSVYLNTHDGASATVTQPSGSPINLGFQAESVTSGDFNRDGILDLVVGNRTGTGNTAVLIGDGAGGFTQTNFITSTGPQYVTTSDLNKDGLVDIAVANNNPDQVAILLNTAPPPPIPSIDSISTSSATAGGVVILRGSNFTAGGSPTVTFTGIGGSANGTIISQTDSEIIVQVPGGVGVTGGSTVEVNVNGEISNTENVDIFPSINSITITPINPTIDIAQTQQFTATATFSDSTQAPITQGPALGIASIAGVNRIVVVDDQTGSLIPFGDLGTSSVGGGVSAFDPVQGRYFFSGQGKIWTIDAVNGGILFESAFSGADGVSSLEYDSVNGILFGIALFPDTTVAPTRVNKVVTVNPNTGVITPVAADGQGILPGPQNVSAGVSAFNQTNGQYYVAVGEEYVALDTTTGNLNPGTGRVFSDLGIQGVSSMEFDQISGTLFGIALVQDGGLVNKLVDLGLSGVGGGVVAAVSQGILPGPQNVSGGLATLDEQNRYIVTAGGNLGVVDIQTGLVVSNISFLGVTSLEIPPFWISRDTGIATIDVEGLATGSGAGTTEIQVTAGNSIDVTDLTVQIPLIADLSINQSDSDDPVTVGTNFDYQITVSNAGPSAVGSLTVTDTLPSGVTFVSASGTNWICLETVADTEVQCTDSDGMGVGANDTITITVTAPLTPGILSNTANVVGDLPDPNSSNDSLAITTVVQTATPNADFDVTITDSADPVSVGANYSYTVTVNNSGPDVALETMVTATVPGGVTLNSATFPGGSCSGSTTVTCNLGDLDTGTGTQIVFNVTATAAGSQALTVTAESTGLNAVPDPNPANNTDISQSTMVLAAGQNVFIVNSIRDAGDAADANTGDNICETINPGECTLRAAIEQANATADTAGPNVIAFNIPPLEGSHLIQVTFSLPSISTGSVIIDGTTEPDFAGVPIVEVRGLGTTFVQGLHFGTASGPNTVRGLIINRFGNNPQGFGIRMSGNGQVIVEGNIIGTDASSTFGIGNFHGINLGGVGGHRIGGTVPSARNIISGNQSAVVVSPGSNGNMIQGNYIGTDLTGTTARANTNIALFIQGSNNTIGGTIGVTPGGLCTGACNLISGNNGGLSVLAPGVSNQIQGNYIGTDVTGQHHSGITAGLASVQEPAAIRLAA